MAVTNTPKRVYKDIDMAFKPNILTKDVGKKVDVNAVKQALKNILLTRKGEKPFQPNYGSGVYDLLFEPMDYGSAALIKKEISDTLNRYEPRVSITRLYCFPDYGNNGYEVELEYVILDREDKPVALEIFLERTR